MAKETRNFVALSSIGWARGMSNGTASHPGLTAQQASPLTAAAVRDKLSSVRGKRYWRTLEELAETPEFHEMLEREFPRHAAEWTDPVSRRGFLKLAGASLALAGLSACTKQPEEAIVPYVRQPEDLVPGKSMFYSTAMPFPTGAQPLLVKSFMYRPIKVEGNPEHPMSQGATDAIAQASLLDLYDPDRSQTVTYLGEARPYGDFMTAMQPLLNAQRAANGAGIRFLTTTVISPSLGDQFKKVLEAYPQAKWYQYDPVNRDSARAGAKMAFGQYVDAQYNIQAADLILSLDADFLSGIQFPGFVRYARDYAIRRKAADNANFNRLYVVESTPTTTGMKADHRLSLRASEIEQFASALAAALGAGGAASNLNSEAQKFLQAVVAELKAKRGASVVIPGEYQTPQVHALAAALNSALGNIGKTVSYTDPIEPAPMEQTSGLRQLVDEMRAGKVELLVIMGTNPVYHAPVDLDFVGALDTVENRVHLGLHRDETSQYCQWHINEAHYLESWSDARAWDGTVTIVQPLIDPLYGGKTMHEVLAVFSDQPAFSSYDIVRAYWQSQLKGGDFETAWRRALHDGFIPNTAAQPRALTARPVVPLSSASRDAQDIEIVFRPDPSLYDGRYANNGWLQELPKPLSKISWDNAAIFSMQTAAALKVVEGDVVELESNGKRNIASVLVMPGMPDNQVLVYLGHGRTHAGRVGNGTGFNSYLLRTSSAPLFATGTKVRKMEGKWAIAITRSHHLIDAGNGKVESFEGVEAESRDLVRTITLPAFRKGEEEIKERIQGRAEAPTREQTLYPNYSYDAVAWGMAIDMNSCVGCNACVVACVAENNIPVVGKEQVKIGREMHWLRIDTYYQGDVANPKAHFQPLPCMQCENAPCEPVCPVGATVHSAEGLNNMIYNRCVGTRYCSNNCPYKVRHFNFLLYQDFDTPSFKLMRNPDVSVRSRGVMEKCTYCVQRISEKRIQAEKEDRRIRDQEVVTACAQACPTEAIYFGDINDSQSKVRKLKGSPLNYALLADVNTRPRTTYLAEVMNPNPQLGSGETTEAAITKAVHD